MNENVMCKPDQLPEYEYDIFVKDYGNSGWRKANSTTNFDALCRMVDDITNYHADKEAPWHISCTNKKTHEIFRWNTANDLDNHALMLERRIWIGKPVTCADKSAINKDSLKPELREFPSNKDSISKKEVIENGIDALVDKAKAVDHMNALLKTAQEKEVAEFNKKSKDTIQVILKQADLNLENDLTGSAEERAKEMIREQTERVANKNLKDMPTINHMFQQGGIVKAENARFHFMPEAKPVDAIAKAVDPDHYKGFVGDLQWLDVMSRIPSMRDPAKFKAALELQVRKYLDRLGRKDTELQELKKAAFYLKYWIAYIENDNKPIIIENTPSLKA